MRQPLNYFTFVGLLFGYFISRSVSTGDMFFWDILATLSLAKRYPWLSIATEAKPRKFGPN